MKAIILIFLLIPALALAEDCRLIETPSGVVAECSGSPKVEPKPEEPRNWLKEIQEAEARDKAKQEAARKELEAVREERRRLERTVGHE